MEQSDLCRVCNIPSGNCLPLFTPHLVSGELTTLAKILSYCSGLTLLETEDYLPQHICQGCSVKLRRYWEFKRVALKTDAVLRQLYKGLKVKEKYYYVSGEEVGEEQHMEEDDEAIDQEFELDQELVHEDDFVVVNEASQEDEDELEIKVEEELSAKLWKRSIADLEVDDIQDVIIEETSHSQLFMEEEEDTQDNYEEIGEPTEEQPQEAKTQPSGNRSRRKKTTNPSLKCPICEKQLSTSNSFKYHMQLHSDQKPYVCQICGESFKTRNAHDGHATLHDPNNPNTCPTCGKVYRQASSLRTHLLTHSGIKPFECGVCGKRLTQKSGYKKHMLTHTGEKPHECDICKRTFRYSSNLIAHKRSHSQSKPHHCLVCQKRSFGTTTELNRHMLVHSSDRPFECPECSKTFKRQVSLTLHIQSHKNPNAGKMKKKKEWVDL
ncbi:zinc finger protein 514 [Drosophila bipectinata]|uniref:zinc finger protein 514 n=1 Tax=Drosophila bipectinata TaxID=42026 RepID=UPI001C8925AA|nr:zinc finger and SCAN domain-containing protein 2 [Drosophila bipectinata]